MVKQIKRRNQLTLCDIYINRASEQWCRPAPDHRDIWRTRPYPPSEYLLQKINKTGNDKFASRKVSIMNILHEHLKFRTQIMEDIIRPLCQIFAVQCCLQRPDPTQKIIKMLTNQCLSQETQIEFTISLQYVWHVEAPDDWVMKVLRQTCGMAFSCSNHNRSNLGIKEAKPASLVKLHKTTVL